jgi:hypothetical protein
MSRLRYLSISIPLFIAILNIITPAGAEQIDRTYSISARESQSRIADTIPSVTDLNLMVPVPSSELAPGGGEDREQSSFFEPIWSDPSRNNSSKSVIKRQSSRLKSTSRPRNLAATNIKSSISLTSEQPNKIKAIPRRRILIATNINPATATTARINYKSKSSSRQKIATILPPSSSGNYMRLVRDPNKGTNDVGNPLYTLETYVDGQIYQTFNAVSGTATSQNADRNRENQHAPLPDGLYTVSNQIVPGAVPEVGKTFIGISPRFETGRNDLGIHFDPSFNKRNGYDGTAGCIGITTVSDRDAINEFVTKYRPRNLLVRIISSES